MSFDDTSTGPRPAPPTGGVNKERVIAQLAPDQHLLERILATENVSLAWKRVKANKGQPGVDGVTVEAFPEQTRSQWSGIRQSLFEGEYEPKPVRRVEIPKATRGTRPLGIPTVQDRMIQQAMAQQMSPLFEPGFSNYSYGFRPKRSAHQAVYQLREYIQSGYRIAVDVSTAVLIRMARSAYD